MKNETKSIEDLQIAMTTRLSEHAALALMFRGIFEMHDERAKHDSGDDIWHGLAVIADRLHDECEALESHVHELRRLLEGGSR